MTDQILMRQFPAHLFDPVRQIRSPRDTGNRIRPSHHNRKSDLSWHRIDPVLLGKSSDQILKHFCTQLLDKGIQLGKHPFFHIGIHRQPVQQQDIRAFPRQDLRIQLPDRILSGNGLSFVHTDFIFHKNIRVLDLVKRDCCGQIHIFLQTVHLKIFLRYGHPVGIIRKLDQLSVI